MRIINKTHYQTKYLFHLCLECFVQLPKNPYNHTIEFNNTHGSYITRPLSLSDTRYIPIGLPPAPYYKHIRIDDKRKQASPIGTPVAARALVHTLTILLAESKGIKAMVHKQWKECADFWPNEFVPIDHNKTKTEIIVLEEKIEKT